MPDVIFTLGYQQRSIDEYVRLLSEAEITVLIDVRETAWSHKPGFSKSAFAARLEAAGIEYVHASFAGNPKWLRENAASHDECLTWYAWYVDEFSEVIDALEGLLSEVQSAGKRVALACFERHADDCHRAILAERWVARDDDRHVTHLAIDGCARLAAV